jgi:hypothetical protein
MLSACLWIVRGLIASNVAAWAVVSPRMKRRRTSASRGESPSANTHAMRRAVATMMISLLALAAPVAATAAGKAAKKPKVVGTVTALSGTKKLEAPKGKHLRAVHKGDKVTLDQVLVVGKGAKATIRLKRPKGVRKGTDLIQLTPAKGAKPVNRAKRRRGVITVSIAPR